MIYNNLLLNVKIFNDLLKYKSNNKLPNAFIFHGINGVGKEAHAIEFFASLNCKDKNDNSCGFCKSCVKTKKMQHEDLDIIFPLPKSNSIRRNDSPLRALNNIDIESMQKMFLKKGSNPYSRIKFKSANTILINSIREIKKNINLSINDGKCKVYLILEAEKLCYPNTEAANSLLKILEEPPKNILFILVTADISLLLDTIISRCIPIYFPKLKNMEINKYLTDKHPTKNTQNTEIANISGGSIVNALLLSENYDNNMQVLHSIINIIINDDYNNLDELSSYFKNKDESIELLNLLNLFFRDIILKTMHFTYLNDLVDVINTKYNKIDWSKCILLVNNTQKYILKNGNIELMVISLIFEIKKILNHKYHNINILEEYLTYKV